MRVIIIGVGIAGVTAAMALEGMGVESEVFEARDQPEQSGGFFLANA